MRILHVTRPGVARSGSHARRLRPAGVAALLAAATIAMLAPAGASAKTKGYTVKAASGTLAITFTPTIWASLNSSEGKALGKSATALTPATATPAGVLTFPITHGSLNSATGRGKVSARGGLMLESHINLGIFESSSSASAAEPVVSIGATSTITMTSANFTPPSVPLITLRTAHVKAVGGRHAVSLSKIPATLTQAGAEFFGSAFTVGEQIGTATVVIRD